MSRLQKVETRKLQLAGTGERLMISICRGVLQYAPTTQRSLPLFACPRTEKFTFCRRLLLYKNSKFEFLNFRSSEN
jgi:hypothetical protein